MTDIFSGNDPAPEVAYEDLVGEGKRYKDNSAAAKAIVEKDAFIERLKQEAEEARQAALAAKAELEKRMNEEEFLAKMEQLSRQSPNVEQNPPVDRDNGSALKPEDVEAILEKREAEKTRKANLAEVERKLQEALGEAYRTHIRQQSQALGMTTAELTDLASKNPQAFYRLVGLDGNQRAPQDDAPPRSTVTTTSTTSGKKDYNYWKKLRQEKGDRWYFSVPVQQAIWEEQKRLGDAFLPQ